MTNSMLLEVVGLSLGSAPQQLLKDIELRVAQGECITLVGANGAGKTTLLKVVAGLLRGYHGSVRIGGREVRNLSPQEISRSVSLVPQRLSHIPPFTVAEFMALSGPDSSGQGISLVRNLEGRLLTQLSGGELQRVLIAGAVAQGASLLLLDEPTANIDPRGRRQLEEVLTECRRSMGISYVLVTHDVSLGLRSSETVVVMRDGNVVKRCPVSDPDLVRSLSEAYGCRFVELHHDDLPCPAVVSL